VKELILRDYQNKLKQDAYNSWNDGNRNVLAVLSTGGGKSKIMSSITLDHYRANQRVSIMAHRNELVTQMSLHIAECGIPHRIIGAKNTVTQAINIHKKNLGKSFINPTAATSVIGVDTLMARSDDLTAWAKQVDVWLMDEAHHSIGNDKVDPNKWGKAVKLFTNARGMGFTATPVRADGQGLGRTSDGCMDSMVIGPDTRWLINNQHLCEYEIVCPTSDLQVEDSKLSKDGDWSSQTLRKAAEKSKIVGDVAENYCRHALGRKAVVFATDCETADEIAKQFNDWGINAASVNGKSLTAYRVQVLEDFAAGKISVLINVDLFDEGFDLPTCEVVIMARPTASLGKYLQMIGRVLRFLPGKTALVIDHVSNVIRHNLPDKPRLWTLDRREKRAKHVKDPDEIELTICKSPECAKPYEKFREVCPYCGFAKPLPNPADRSIEMVDGDLTLLDKAALDKMRAAMELETPASIADRVGHVAGPIAGKAASNRQNEKMEAHEQLEENIAQWAGIERVKGFTDREIQKKFYLTAGIDVLSALDGSRKRKEFEQLSETVRNWYE